MHKSLSVVFSIFLLGSFVGCATMSKEECFEADWYQVGYRDGRAGMPRAQFQRHSEACIEHGVRPERGAYYRGRDQGIRSYCTEDNGYALGKRGRAYRGACPAELEAAFLKAYRSGLEIHQYESEVDRLQRRVRTIEKQIAQKEDRVYTADLTKAQRLELRYEIKKLELERVEAETQLQELEQQHPENGATAP